MEGGEKMKKSIIDPKSFIIGILLAIIIVMCIGAGDKDGVFDIIKAKKLIITNEEGKGAVEISGSGGGWIVVKNKEGLQRTHIGDGHIYLSRADGALSISLIGGEEEKGGFISLTQTYR